MSDNIFDSSAIINCIKAGKADKLLGQYTIELTKFEIGNYIWKRRSGLTEEECLKILRSILVLIESMNLLQVNFEEVMMIALKENITFYDASYLQAAIQYKLKLVTDDLKLYGVACKYVKSLRSLNL
ncbi:hypothetical protein HRbin06_00549 [archaeon HR06]|nr:hypothetical protein HRbin06_00549 [archaeon HR06]